MCHICDKKVNRKSKKEKKLHKAGGKCPENDDEKNKLPKCPKPKRPRPKPRKCLTRIEKIMLRIQPPIAARERYLHPEHVNCFLEESERIYVNKPRCRPCPPERPRVCVEDKRKKKTQKSDKDADGKNDQDKEIENGKDNDAESGAVKQEGEANVTVEEDKNKLEQKEAEGRARTNKRKRNRKRQKHKEVVQEESDSEMSICSNDSEVCLVGLALTAEDKGKIEENRRRVHPPPDNEENNTESNKNAEGLSIQEGENNQ